MNEHLSIRIILLNENNKILLMKAEDPTTTEADGTYNGAFWFLIGGQIEENENYIDTAKREIKEETGLDANQIEIGPIIWFGEFDLVLSGIKRRMKQRFVLARTSSSNVSLHSLTEAEKKVIKKIDWFSLGEMKACKEVIYPVGLEDYLEPILVGNIPKTPIEIVLDRKAKKRR